MGILLIFLLSKAMAFPVVPPPRSDCSIHRVDFLEPVETLNQLNLPLKAMQSTPLIELLSEDGKLDARCTSNVVSDAGTLMTAGHCMDACLNRAGVIEKLDGMTRVNQDRMTSVRCKIRVNGQVTEAEVLATNDCREIAEWNNSAPRICGADFALLKLTETSALKDAGCFQVSARKIDHGTRVATIGYPYKTVRARFKTGAKDSDGKSQYASFGEVIPFQTTCDTLIDVYKDKPFARDMSRALSVQLDRDRVSSGRSIQTNVDVTKGNSGGGLIDVATGEIVGIASASVVLNQLQECKGASFFSSTREMREILSKDYPRLDLKQTFQCDKKALVRSQGI